MNFLPVFSRIILLVLSVIVLVDKFIPQVRLSVDDRLLYAGIGLYLLLLIIELAMNTWDIRTVKDTTGLSFNYLTKGLIFRKVIVFFILAGMIVIALVITEVAVFRVLVIAVALAEVFAFIVRLAVRYYRVVIDEEKLSVIGDQRKVAHYSRISDVEFRYEIFFFRMKDGNVYEVHLPSIKENEQKRFVNTIMQWLAAHNIALTEEGKQKLQAFI